MNRIDFKKLIKNYQERKLSKEKMEVMDDWYDSIYFDEKSEWSEADKINVKNRILSEIEKGNTSKPIITIKRILYAASILLILGLSYWFMLPKLQLQPIIPGSPQAYIADSDGHMIAFSDLLQDSSYSVNGLTLVKTGQDSLHFLGEGNPQLLVNTIKTPSNGNIHLILPDGTGVQLNANSEIQFPSAFANTERIVTLKGEALFDVQKSPQGKRFIVNLDKDQVIVKGTKFNINYKEKENTKAISLLEGVVAVENESLDIVELAPGQQVYIDAKGKYSISEFDESLIMAWSKGYFVLNGKNIHQILDEIKDWYQVEISIDHTDYHTKYAGQVSKFGNIQDLLEILELTKTYTFKIEGRRIIAKKL